MTRDGPRSYDVFPSMDGRSLAQVVRVLTKDAAWSEVKRLIEKRFVLVNGNLCVDEGRRLKKGEKITLLDEAMPPPVRAEDLNLVYVDEHLLVVDKPAGLITTRHAEEHDWPDHRKAKMPTLEELLPIALSARGERGGTVERTEHRTAHLPNDRGGRPGGRPFPLAPRGEQRRDSRPPTGRGGPPLRGPGSRPFPGAKVAPPFVRAVHRLDRDTSGLMVFARSQKVEHALIELFKDHDIERRYKAVVLGALTEPATIETWLARDRGDGQRGSLPADAEPGARADAQRAVTHVKPLETIAGGAYSVVECRLETGRTHQIRIHLSERGHPVCGDKLYGATVNGRPLADDSDAPRHALHAFELAFEHPITRKQLSFATDWPRDLRNWLKRLRG